MCAFEAPAGLLGPIEALCGIVSRAQEDFCKSAISGSRGLHSCAQQVGGYGKG
jgi:hypothetical protein